jgi:hypothetical protein
MADTADAVCHIDSRKRTANRPWTKKRFFVQPVTDHGAQTIRTVFLPPLTFAPGLFFGMYLFGLPFVSSAIRGILPWKGKYIILNVTIQGRST